MTRSATIRPRRRFGSYRLLELLGSGGTASVYRARDLRAPRDVALKILRPDVRIRPDDFHRFAREALWLSRCDAPHVVRVYAAGEIERVPYIAMELLPRTLQHQASQPPPDLKTLIALGAGILMGLAAAHREGIIHGDIKPANVGLSAEGMVKLLDFGVANPLPWSAHHSETATHPTSCCGTLHYMAPEQLREEAVDQRADIYSTGVVLYELSTGRRPFPALKPVNLIDAVLHQAPLPPSLLNSRLPSEFDTLVMTALAKHPSARYLSAADMMDALLHIADAPDSCGESVVLRLSSDSSRRNPDVLTRLDRAARPVLHAGAPRPCAIGRRRGAQSIARAVCPGAQPVGAWPAPRLCARRP